ncbi:MAG: polyprenyl synthetase family protein [Gemmatimonadaceae bacterium]
MSDPVEATLARWRQDIDDRLTRIAAAAPDLPEWLREPVHYSLTGEGKRLRGLLVMAAYDAMHGRRDASGLAAGIEVIHAYSLVHDDLPCMDNDSMRRGRPTTHRAFDVATATVAGVTMVPLAVEQVLDAAAELALDDATARRMVGVLMHASGAGGMVGGQLMDLEGERRALALGELEAMHRAKTGALIAAAVALGGMAAGADDRALAALTAAGHALGLAFQIADDVLDATESSEALGKTAGNDAVHAKSTYASVLGVAAARRRVETLVADAMAHLESATLKTPPLERLAHFVAARRS